VNRDWLKVSDYYGNKSYMLTILEVQSLTQQSEIMLIKTIRFKVHTVRYEMIDDIWYMIYDRWYMIYDRC
jgi:hypothetical protein